MDGKTDRKKDGLNGVMETTGRQVRRHIEAAKITDVGRLNKI